MTSGCWCRRKSRRELDDDFRRKSIKLREGPFLHGELEVDIQEARDLPDTDNFLFNIKNCFGQEKDVTDPYVAVCLDNTRIITTSVIYNNLCPQWNEFFRVSVCHYAKVLSFRIKDQDELGTEMVGEVNIPVEDLLKKPNLSIIGWQDIIDTQHKNQGQLYIKIIYKPYVDNFSPNVELACPDTYFPLRKSNRVTLYSCARSLPTKDAAGKSFQSPSLWLDLYSSLVAARKFIYITGWSVNTNIKLLRGNDWQLLKTKTEVDLASLTLGELLLKKAEDGVRVLIMIWGETTSIMGTHDTETENFFKGTRVFVARVGRQTKTREYKDLEAHFTANLGYSHHQKAVILDAAIGTEDDHNQKKTTTTSTNQDPRRIVAYVGGIDLTDGRYDTPEHSLFGTLLNEHKGDFYQPCEPNIKSQYGPRMPWQDIHARVEGPAARDIMKNFVERWGKERPLNTRLLIQNVEAPNFILDAVPAASDENNIDDAHIFENGKNSEESKPESRLSGSESSSSSSGDWNVQVFRSITSDSARFDLEKETSFTTKKGRSVDNSIMRAYTNAIRRAKRFIYIENQYFMGSAYGWLDDQDVHCYNVIPMEITQQICDAISEGRRFTVYIVIPMHPEGVPSDNAIQEMLFWQHHTMQMMYSRIAQAIDASGLDCHPTEYLMFFCLGKKEAVEQIPSELSKPPRGSRSSKLRKTRRHMIYVHSKLIIVDDSYVITGSANINQRSLDGDRDSELAIGAYQPQYVCQDFESPLPLGEIHKFRTNLFAEHLGLPHPLFKDPGSESCARYIRESAWQNWKDYEASTSSAHKNCASPDIVPQGHLLSYPVDVNVSVHDNVPIVTLHARTKKGKFPDSKANISGQGSKSIPNKLTT